MPDGFVRSYGSVVTVRAVKLLHKIENPDDPDTRDAWWNEIRDEIRSHASSLGHTAVIGYNETTSICDNLCLLSATGTAATVNTDPSEGVAYSYRGTSPARVRGIQSSLEVSPLDINESASAEHEVGQNTHGSVAVHCLLPPFAVVR